MASLKIKKGQIANLPVSKEEDTLYICEEGNLFYDFSSNKRIALKNNSNNNIAFSDESFVNGEGNICSGTSITNGHGIIRKIPIHTIDIKPVYSGPSGSPDYPTYIPTNVLHFSFSDSYTSQEERPEYWDELKNIINQLEPIDEYREGMAVFNEVLPDIIYPVALCVDDENYGIYNLIGKDVLEYKNPVHDTVLVCRFCLTSLNESDWSNEKGIKLVREIKQNFPEAFSVETDEKSWADPTEIIKALHINSNHTIFINIGTQLNNTSGSLTNGYGNINTGVSSLVSGNGLQNNKPYTTTIGKFNKRNSNYMFSIGNGLNAKNRKNIFGITDTGRVNTLGSYTTGGADYAEYFEWKEIPEIKDVRGLFVTLDNNKIRLATKKDSYILGIISSNPGLIGNNSVEEWSYKYKTDIFGNKILDKNGKEIISKKYDNTKKYIPRSQRKEWVAVGMLGQIIVTDDGTCKPGKYCYPGKKGIATKAKKGYYVMERLDNNHIKVLFK